MLDWYRVEWLAWPADWPAFFGRRGALLVEIGFGGGEFLVELARQQPQANVLGAEISLPSLRRGVKKIANHGLGNVRLIQGSAESVLWLLCRHGELNGVYINYPDPWPKRDHHGRRLFNELFVELLASRMSAGAVLEAATDDAAYAAAISELLLRSAYFDSQRERPYTTEDRQRLKTKYETLAEASGRTSHYFKWRRNSVDAPDRFSIPEELAMPHLILQTPLSLDMVGRRFQPVSIEQNGIRLKLMECYHSLRDGKLLIELMVTEGPLQQHVCLSLQPRAAEKELMVGLYDIGHPRPTRGIHAAIAYLGKWLQALAPETVILQSNVVGMVTDDSEGASNTDEPAEREAS